MIPKEETILNVKDALKSVKNGKLLDNSYLDVDEATNVNEVNEIISEKPKEESKQESKQEETKDTSDVTTEENENKEISDNNIEINNQEENDN